MPTGRRLREASDDATALPVAVLRHAGAPLGAAAPPPEDLLPSGGTDHRGGPGSAWGADPGFRAQVEVIRAQLAPVHSRAALASSYGREAGARDPAGASWSALLVAYAYRWLELAEPDPIEATWSDGPDTVFA